MAVVYALLWTKCVSFAALYYLYLRFLKGLKPWCHAANCNAGFMALPRFFAYCPCIEIDLRGSRRWLFWGAVAGRHSELQVHAGA